METTAAPTLSQRGSLLGVLAFLSAVLAALSVAMIGVTSFTAFNPPGWLRILSMAPLPLLIILAVGFGIAGLVRKSGRAWAIAGLALASLSVIAFVVMLNVGR